MESGSRPERPALTRGWFHGWCQCGGHQLALVDVWPALPYVKCADCGRIHQSVLAPFYGRTDTPWGREYISYRPMHWPFYLPAGYESRASWWADDATPRARPATGDVPAAFVPHIP